MGPQRVRHRRLLWLPNVITASRYIFAALALAVTLHHMWALGLWLLLAAIATDFLDGLAAKKLDAKTNLGAELDRWADATVVVAGLLGLSSTGHLSWWVTGMAIAYGLVGEFVSTPSRWPRQAIAVASLFVAWVGIVWYYADIAFGWSWIYVPLTICILIVCALLKRHRIQAWLDNHG